MSGDLGDAGKDLLFREARTRNAWLDRPVADEVLHALYDLMKWGPTSGNCCPVRLLFLKTPAAKERLRPALSAGNVAKTMAAPVTAVVAWDTRFYEHMPQLFPHEPDARSWFEGPRAEEHGFRNGTLQGAYMIIAARAVGLDCGPMSGFDRAAVDAEFFPDGRFRSNFLCNLGYGSDEKLFARSPRFDFEEICRIL